MEKTSEQMYTDLLRQLADPTVVEPDVLAGYLRDVERMHSMGHITEWQFQRARDAYAATIERDPRQSLVPPSETVPGVGLDQLGERNLDPISGAPGAHPVGTGLGAAMGGAAAGAVVASVAGPVGTFIGAAVGAVLGGLAGKGVAELVDPTVEDAYWRDSFAARAYASPESTYDDYGPAYAYGARAYGASEGKSFDAAEEALSAGWNQARGSSTLEWERARAATRDAWERAGQRR